MEILHIFMKFIKSKFFMIKPEQFCLKCSANFIIVLKAKVTCLNAYFVKVKKQVKGYLNNRS